MNTAIILIAAVLLIPILFFAGIVVYANILMLKRPFLRLYEMRKAEEDYCPVEKVPKLFIHFLLQIEDRYFYEHPGFLRENIRDAIALNLKAKKIISGGSTITQQLAKNLYFNFRKNYLRKAAEFIITLSIEKKMSKDEILDLYMNLIYFGNGLYGITDGCAFYFGKKPWELTTNQMFIMACAPYAPTKGNIFRYPEVFERIRNKRLDLLKKRGEISKEDEELIRSYRAAELDPELRKNDEFTLDYPDEVCLNNDRFGPKPVPERVTRS